jgi:hypothetical protein
MHFSMLCLSWWSVHGTPVTLLTGLFRQSVFDRLASYEDVNDADRLAHDPAMRAVVGSRRKLSPFPGARSRWEKG